MSREVGLWIDHTRAVIVTIFGGKDETRQVRSNIGKYVYFFGGSNSSPLFGTCDISGKGQQDVEFRNFLNGYYDSVISLIRHADTIWIFGPGEAKGELEKHLRKKQFNAHIVRIESRERMTDRQIAAKVRQLHQEDQ
jgi:hypothetical protein